MLEIQPQTLPPHVLPEIRIEIAFHADPRREEHLQIYIRQFCPAFVLRTEMLDRMRDHYGDAHGHDCSLDLAGFWADLCGGSYSRSAAMRQLHGRALC